MNENEELHFQLSLGFWAFKHQSANLLSFLVLARTPTAGNFSIIKEKQTKRLTDHFRQIKQGKRRRCYK